MLKYLCLNKSLILLFLEICKEKKARSRQFHSPVTLTKQLVKSVNKQFLSVHMLFQYCFECVTLLVLCTNQILVAAVNGQVAQGNGHSSDHLVRVGA